MQAQKMAVFWAFCILLTFHNIDSAILGCAVMGGPSLTNERLKPPLTVNSRFPLGIESLIVTAISAQIPHPAPLHGPWRHPSILLASAGLCLWGAVRRRPRR